MPLISTMLYGIQVGLNFGNFSGAELRKVESTDPLGKTLALCGFPEQRFS